MRGKERQAREPEPLPIRTNSIPAKLVFTGFRERRISNSDSDSDCDCDSVCNGDSVCEAECEAECEALSKSSFDKHNPNYPTMVLILNPEDEPQELTFKVERTSGQHFDDSSRTITASYALSGHTLMWFSASQFYNESHIPNTKCNIDEEGNLYVTSAPGKRIMGFMTQMIFTPDTPTGTGTPIIQTNFTIIPDIIMPDNDVPK